MLIPTPSLKVVAIVVVVVSSIAFGLGFSYGKSYQDNKLQIQHAKQIAKLEAEWKQKYEESVKQSETLAREISKTRKTLAQRKKQLVVIKKQDQKGVLSQSLPADVVSLLQSTATRD
jgi:hypothetical protein